MLIEDPKLNKTLVFAFSLLLIKMQKFKVSEAASLYINELIYRGARSWVLSQSLDLHDNMGVAVDRACLFWEWFRTADWLREYRVEGAEQSLQGWFEKKCVELLQDEHLRFQAPQE